jgi:hypothetical protein
MCTVLSALCIEVCISASLKGTEVREGMALLEYQAMPSLNVVAHYGGLCTFSNRSAPDRVKWCGLSEQAEWTVHHAQNHTLLDYSPPPSQAGRHFGSVL